MTFSCIARHTILSDIYKIKRHPGNFHLFLNNGYQGIKLIDIMTGEDWVSLSFPTNYDSKVISAWCFPADGEQVLIMNEETRQGILFSLDSQTEPRSVECPSLPTLTDLRYVWDRNALWITGGKSYQFFRLDIQKEPLSFTSVTGMEVRVKQTEWRRALDQIPPNQCNVLSVEPDLQRMLYRCYNSDPKSVGWIQWTSMERWTVEWDQQAPVLSQAEDSMVILYEYEIIQVFSSGHSSSMLRSPDGFSFITMESLFHPRAGRCLILVCGSLAAPDISQVLVYQVES